MIDLEKDNIQGEIKIDIMVTDIAQDGDENSWCNHPLYRPIPREKENEIMPVQWLLLLLPQSCFPVLYNSVEANHSADAYKV